MTGGSTAGARHLAGSAIWLAWHGTVDAPRMGTLLEAALSHWDAGRFVAFLRWWRSLPC